MTVCTLVAGGDAAWRDTEIAARLDPDAATAVIREGILAGPTPLTTAESAGTLPKTMIVTIAAGCPCCGDGLVMRVTLDRMLRRRPAHLYISLADASHMPHLQQFLATPPYAPRISLDPPIRKQ